MYSVELNGCFIRQGSNRKSMLSFFNRKLSEIGETSDELVLVWNGMVILSNQNKIYNHEDENDN